MRLRRKPKLKSVEVDYIAAMRECGYLHDRVTSIVREAEIAAAALDVPRLKVLRDEQEAALVRMREIAVTVGAKP